MLSAIILIAVGALTIAALIYLIASQRHNTPAEETETDEHKRTNPNLECCGAHEICEAETLLTLSDEVIYYSDDELDAYRGRTPESYSGQEADEFREVLLTLQLHEVAGWLKSLQLRHVELPLDVREEALMIMDDFRRIRRENRSKKEASV